jgi:hypothetical protein
VTVTEQSFNHRDLSSFVIAGNPAGGDDLHWGSGEVLSHSFNIIVDDVANQEITFSGELPDTFTTLTVTRTA